MQEAVHNSCGDSDGCYRGQVRVDCRGSVGLPSILKCVFGSTETGEM